MTSQFADMTLLPNFFWCRFISLVKFSYLPKFHVNTITGSGVIIIFFYKRLTRNPEIGNTPILVLPNIWRLGRVRDTKFGTNVSIEMLLNIAKCQGYSFYHFWVIKRYPPPRLGLSDRKGSRTQNHLLRKRTLNHLVKLAKWMSCVVSTYLYGAFDFEVLAHIDRNFLLYFFVCQVPNPGVPSSKRLGSSNANSAFHPTLNQMFCFRCQNMPRVT